ncbi:MAG: hypothetical protein U0R52_04600 [Solirubrobacterales bacterium]
MENNGTTNTEHDAKRPGRGPGALRLAAWRAQEKIVWPGSDGARAAADEARWPLENVAWWLRSRVAWPAEDAFRRRGQAGRTALAGAAALVIAGAGVTAAYVGTRGGSEPAPEPVARTVPEPAPAPVLAKPVAQPVAGEPTLHGAAPSFAPEADAAKPGSAPAGDHASKSEGTAAPPKPAPSGKALGPAPLRVAERFADAFVNYEVGRSSPAVHEAFSKTATAPLARSLARRPPRQPAGVKVPKARVLNVVPGPHRGGFVAVSVSLLRVGTTSELRLQLQQTARRWRVSDVRG